MRLACWLRIQFVSALTCFVYQCLIVPLCFVLKRVVLHCLILCRIVQVSGKRPFCLICFGNMCGAYWRFNSVSISRSHRTISACSLPNLVRTNRYLFLMLLVRQLEFQRPEFLRRSYEMRYPKSDHLRFQKQLRRKREVFPKLT